MFETFSKSLLKVREKLQKDPQKRPTGSTLGLEGHFLKVFGGYWPLLAPSGSYWLLLVDDLLVFFKLKRSSRFFAKTGLSGEGRFVGEVFKLCL